MLFCSGGNRIVTTVRKLTMYQYGGTIGASKYSKFRNRNTKKESMLPRSVIKSRPNNVGYTQSFKKNHELISSRHEVDNNRDISVSEITDAILKGKVNNSKHNVLG